MCMIFSMEMAEQVRMNNNVADVLSACFCRIFSGQLPKKGRPGVGVGVRVRVRVWFRF